MCKEVAKFLYKIVMINNNKNLSENQKKIAIKRLVATKTRKCKNEL